MVLCVGLITGPVRTFNMLPVEGWVVVCLIPHSLFPLGEPSWEISSKTSVQWNVLSDPYLGVSPTRLSLALALSKDPM